MYLLKNSKNWDMLYLENFKLIYNEKFQKLRYTVFGKFQIIL